MAIKKSFSPSGFKSFVMNDKVAVAVGAVVAAPIAIALASRYRTSIPVIGQYYSLFLVVVALVFLAVAMSLTGYVSAFTYGIAAGALISAFLETGIGSQILSRSRQAAGV